MLSSTPIKNLLGLAWRFLALQKKLFFTIKFLERGNIQFLCFFFVFFVFLWDFQFFLKLCW